MTTILLTGFEPFGGDHVNPSQLAAHALDGRVFGSVHVRSKLLPVEASRAPSALVQAIRDTRPSAVLLTGLAAGRPWLTVERVAVNVLDFRIPDNGGVTRTDDPIVESGPAAYLTTLPARALVDAWRAARVPAAISDTAGLYLCNMVMYLARHELGEGVPCGFVHLPANEDVALNAKTILPYLPQSEIERGIGVALALLARHVAGEESVSRVSRSPRTSFEV
ncbi:pyrrolidone-carboxylate peptidase [Deinococcus yavapaiensis]|uniref:Pyroglutamyl-peptidase I n=1 Tax=Deinococcus yavapaiensis KR-236 TaxID=694435 RepID=A0A318SSL7_9DEIO|nr:pyrrolidone-carboxylate peptidase [Deinococcus yavapaiensis]PYE56206.1 pyroglutamyl-peptidase I [Deinococcus yavapaiensis KR-236]